jgi:hypothetical protein
MFNRSMYYHSVISSLRFIILVCLFLHSGSILLAQFGKIHAIDNCFDYSTLVPSLHDIDNDGDKDLFVHAFGTTHNMTMWFKNIGGYYFHPQPDFEQRLYPEQYVLDLDMDGDLDILGKPNFPFSGLSWYENNGAGEFSGLMDLNIISEIDIEYYSIGDFDEDEDTDIFVCYDLTPNSSMNDYYNILWYENDGNGVFNIEHSIIENHEGPRGIFVGDVEDGSGPELFFYDNNHIVKVQNHLQPELQYLDTIFSGLNLPELYYIHTILVVDYNTDGWNDIVWMTLNGKVYGIPNLGGGQFLTFSTELVDPYEGRTLQFLDLDRDGDLDITAYSSGHQVNELLYYKNDGGIFTEEEEPILESLYASYSDTIDLDDNGHLDVISGTTKMFVGIDFKHDLLVNYQICEPDDDVPTDTTCWFYKEKMVDACLMEFLDDAAVFDVNNDGLEDIVYLLKKKELWYAQNINDKYFSYPILINDNDEDMELVATHDFDGDGDKDILCHYTYGNTIVLLEFENTSVTTHIVAELSVNIFDVGVADFDHDGDIDFWYSNYQNGITLCENNGVGEFQVFMDIDIEIFPSVLDEKNIFPINESSSDLGLLAFRVEGPSLRYLVSFNLEPGIENPTNFITLDTLSSDEVASQNALRLVDWDGDLDMDILLVNEQKNLLLDL